MDKENDIYNNNIFVSSNLYQRSFLYSNRHHEEEVRKSEQYKPGYIKVDGVNSPFTAMVRMTDTDKYLEAYPDARIVCSGDMRRIKFTEASGVEALK